MLLAMSCVSVGIKFLLKNHKKGKKREEKIGLSSNTMEEELEINKKEHKIFLPYSKFQTTPIQIV